LDIPTNPVPYSLLINIGLQILLMLFIVWIIYRCTDVLVPTHHVGFRAIYEHIKKLRKGYGAIEQKSQGNTGRTLVPTLMRYVRNAVIICFALVIAQSFGFPITSILGGLGIVGVAVAFAASTILQNMFGAAVIVLEQLFHLGDWIMINGEEGTVEKIGFRTTTIREWDQRITHIPNLLFITYPVHNMQQTKPYRIQFLIHISKTTPTTKVKEFLEMARKYLETEKEITRSKIYVLELNMQALVIQLTTYTTRWNPKDDVKLNWDWYANFLMLREKLILDLMNIASNVHVDIAMPYMKLNTDTSTKT